MTREVEIVSMETIKPSSPTPAHLKTLQLSLIDQVMPLIYVHLILLYSANQEEKSGERLDHLKKTLSDILVDFYPLAGRISDNRKIDCNDEGVNFIQTRVGGNLNQVVSDPKSEELIQLRPEHDLEGLGPKVLMSIQANIFDCGGIALGVSVLHKVADISSLSFFLNTWSTVTKGGIGGVSPKFGMSSVFPSNDHIPFSPPNSEVGEKVVTRRFVFNSANIAALTQKCSHDVKLPTRVEAVSALIWKCAIKATNPASAASHAVDLRGKMTPPLSNNSFGNLVSASVATTTSESSVELGCLAGMLRGAIRKINGEYVIKVQGGPGAFAPLLKAYELYMKGEIQYYTFTSWCRFSFYENDFGWGKPIWASPASVPVKNSVTLIDTKSGDGIEAWIALREAEMARFECEPELIAFTSHEQNA